MFDRSRTLSAAIATATLAFVVSAFAADSKRDASRSESFRGFANTNHVFSGHKAHRLRHKTTRPRARHGGRRDRTAPDTAIMFGPSGTIPVPASAFAFSASEAGSTFECRLDEADWHACSSPEPVSGMTEGRHTFAVRAIDRAGNTDPTPAVRSFAVDLPSIPPTPRIPPIPRIHPIPRFHRSPGSPDPPIPPTHPSRSPGSHRPSVPRSPGSTRSPDPAHPDPPIPRIPPIPRFHPPPARLRSSPAPEWCSPRTWPPSRTRA